MTEFNSKNFNSQKAEQKPPFELDHDIDAQFRNAQKAIDEKTPAEYQEVLKYLDESAAHLKDLIPDFVCHLARNSENSSTFTYKETTTQLDLVKEHLPERGRDYALRITTSNGKSNNYRPYQHEEGLVWICDHRSGEDLVGISKDFVAKIVEKCSRG